MLYVLSIYYTCYRHMMHVTTGAGFQCYCLASDDINHSHIRLSLQCVLYTLEIYDTSLYIHDGYIFDLLITYDTHCLQVWCIVMITSTWLFYSYIMVIVTSTALIHHGHLICLPNFVIMINIDNY